MSVVAVCPVDVMLFIIVLYSLVLLWFNVMSFNQPAFIMIYCDVFNQPVFIVIYCNVFNQPVFIVVYCDVFNQPVFIVIYCDVF